VFHSGRTGGFLLFCEWGVRQETWDAIVEEAWHPVYTFVLVELLECETGAISPRFLCSRSPLEQQTWRSNLSTTAGEQGMSRGNTGLHDVSILFSERSKGNKLSRRVVDLG
jgi:hypothetical protein